VKCDQPLGKNVFAYNNDWVVKVFTDDAKLQAEIRAHEVLKKLHKAKPDDVEPLRFEVVEPKAPNFEAPHLRIERFVPWSELRSSGKTVPLWQLKELMSRQHVSGIAHGALTAERIGFVPDKRFAVTCSHQVVSPLSEFFDGELGPDETRVAAILRKLVARRGKLLYTLVIVGPIDGVSDADAGAVAAVVKAHNAFVQAAENDADVLGELCHIEISKPGRPMNLGKMTTAEAKALREAGRRNAAPIKTIAITDDTDKTMSCAECDEKINEGFHGRVYHHKHLPGKVVKVFNLETEANHEARAFGVLRRVGESDPSFRYLHAELLPASESRARACMVIDKFKGSLQSYVGLVGKEQVHDLLDQLDILHRHGVAHGDLHGGNIGLRDTGFVIGDPTLLQVSPLSELYDEPVDPDAMPILAALRKATKQGRPGPESTHMWVLNKPVSITRSAVLDFLRGSSVGYSDAAVERAVAFINAHNAVTKTMQLDRVYLMREFGSFTSDKEWSFVFDRLRVRI
jgi:hypothetical protein